MPIFAYAQTSEVGLPSTYKAEAISLANSIYNQNLVISPDLSYANIKFYKKTPTEKLRTLRSISMDALIHRNSLDKLKSIEIYEKEATKQNSQADIEIVNLYKIHQELLILDMQSNEAKALLTDLDLLHTHENWFIANRALILHAEIQGSNGKLGPAINLAQSALSLIPTTPSMETKEAAYETNDIIAYLNTLMNNPKLMLEATQQVITQGQGLNRSIDGIGHIGNLSYIFQKWRDFETAAKLTETLIALTEKNDLGVNSIAYLRYGQSLNHIGQFEKAKSYLKTALVEEKNIRLQIALEGQLAISYAGIGNTAAMNASFRRMNKSAKSAGIDDNVFTKNHLHARALLAVQHGNASAVYKYVNERFDIELLQTFKRIGNTAQLQLAELANDKQRQKEQETARRREDALQQKQLEAKQRSLMLLVFLVISLACITLGAVATAMWRQRTNQTLVAAAHTANAGNRAKSQFLSVMSHEFRTPLNGIIGISGLLSEYGETETLRDQNKIILDSGHSLLETLNGIIDMSQMESGSLDIVTAPTDMHQIMGGLHEIFKTQIDTTQIKFTCHTAKDIPLTLMLDSIRIKQALSNLISNAVKFTQQGRIHVHVTLSETDDTNPVQTLTMIIADTGQGISEDAQINLFKPFVQADSTLTRSHGGAGVGLTVTRGLARLMGGDVITRSTVGRGSEFIMTVQTCEVERATFDNETNRPSFIIEPNTKQVVDFSPATSVEALKNETKTTPVTMADIIPDNMRETEENNEQIIDIEILNSDQNAYDDFAELESLLVLDTHTEFETLSTPEEIEAQEAQVSTTTHQTDTAAIPNETQFVPQPVTDIQTTQELRQDPRPAAQDDRAFTRRTARPNDQHISADTLEDLNVLVVEDVIANQIVLRSLLEPAGCHITMAEHGQKALDIMSVQMFDVVLMDIRMPVMNGIEATQKIRLLSGPQQNVPIIASNRRCLSGK